MLMIEAGTKNGLMRRSWIGQLGMRVLDQRQSARSRSDQYADPLQFASLTTTPLSLIAWIPAAMP